MTTPNAEAAIAALEDEALRHERHGRINRAEALRRQARLYREDPQSAEAYAAGLPGPETRGALESAMPELAARINAVLEAIVGLLDELTSLRGRVDEFLSQGADDVQPDAAPSEGGGNTVPAGPAPQPPGEEANDLLPPSPPAVGDPGVTAGDDATDPSTSPGADIDAMTGDQLREALAQLRDDGKDVPAYSSLHVDELRDLYRTLTA